MKKFFEMNIDHQIEQILEVIQKNKLNRTLLVDTQSDQQQENDPFIDLYWKLKEVEENHNPIPVPKNVRFRFIKRVISKLIRTYTTKQVHFNTSAMSFMSLALNHFKQLYHQQIKEKNELEQRLRNIEQKLLLYDDLSTKINNVLSDVDRLRIENERISKVISDVNCLQIEYESINKVANQLLIKMEQNDKRYLEDMNQIQHSINQIADSNNKLDTVIRTQENLNEWLMLLQQNQENTNKWMSLLSERIDNLENYQGKLRKELFAELSFSTKEAKEKIAKIEILNKEKYKSMLLNNNIKVNLGCGTLMMEDYLNIDARKIEGVDIVADVRELPFNNESIKELYLSHVIEHFSETEMEKKILPYWYSIIKPGGIIRIICPNWEQMLKGYFEGKIDYDTLKEVTFGSQEYDGNYHYNMFTPSTLVKLLETVGFSEVKVIEEARQNGLCIEMEILGVK